MFFNDHNPPHFHAEYQDQEAIVDIYSLQILKDYLPKRAKMMVVEWALEHREELLANRNKARIPEPLDKIQSLE